MPDGEQAHHARAENHHAQQLAHVEPGAVPASHDVAEMVTPRHMQEENERLVAALSSVRAAVTLSDPRLPDQPLIYVNPAFTAITGYTAEDVVGRNCRFLQGPETDRAVVAQLRAAIAAGESLTVELLNYRKDGTPFWNEVAISPVRTAGGEVHTFIGLQHDITARKQAEQQGKEEQEQRVRAVTHSAREAVISADPHGQITFWSPGARALFGYTEEEARQRTLPDLLPGRYRTACAAFLASVARGDRRDLVGQIQEAEGLPRDGAVFPLEYSLATWTAGGQTSLTAIIRDISERRRGEERLRFQARLLDTVGQAVIATDLSGAIVYWNHAAETLYGWPAAEAHGRDIRAVTLSAASARQAEEIRASVQAGQTWTGEFLVQRHDGTTFPALVTDAPLYDAAGAVAGIIGVSVDISELKRTQEMLTYQAFHDPLTGLANRALFLENLEQALAHAARHEGTIAVLSLDLDRFKVINDSLGHAAGDQLLVTVAARLVGCLRQEDTVARLGGDEFAILLGEPVTARQAVRAAERIIHALEAPFLLDDHEVVTATSIGILTSTRRHTPADVARDVDVALYRAKSKGRGRYEIFDETMNAHALERLELEADLRLALERGEFTVYYQPKITLATGQLAGMEALVRWASPTRGLVAPAAFIPLAEETGLIRPLGQWVLEEACRQTRRWHDQAPGAPLVTCVNLSARQFQHPTLVEDVARALQESGVAPPWIELEITESVVMEDAETTIATLHQLKALGVRLAIDDFGTGYSSLSYLKRFPVDTLKIDRSFVSGMQRESDDASIVHAVVSLGHALRLSVVAEGVETAEEEAHLRALGCDLGQGYSFARPLPREQADVFIRTARAAL